MLLLTGYRAELVAAFAAAAPWPEGLAVECLDTGPDTPTGGRVLAAAGRLGGRRFLLAYGDGVADVDLGALAERHAAAGALATMTVVRPELPFGVAMLDAGDRVTGFHEKPRAEHWVNGGLLRPRARGARAPGARPHARARAARGARRGRAARGLPARGLLGLHGHLQGRPRAQRALGGRPRPVAPSRRSRIAAMAGHSKWAGIKHKKAIVDARRGKLFTKLARAITVAAKEGGGDVEGNPSLALAVQKAKDASMPKDNIERAIAKGTGEGGDAEALEAVTYEGYGMAGVALLVEATTDNRNRTGSEVRHAFTKHNGNLGEPGSVAYLFDKKGVVVVDSARYSEDDLMVAIDAGAEDIGTDDDMFEITCEPSDLDRRARGARRGGDRGRERRGRPAPQDAGRARRGRRDEADAADRRPGGPRRRRRGARELRRRRRRARARRGLARLVPAPGGAGPHQGAVAFRSLSRNIG